MESWKKGCAVLFGNIAAWSFRHRWLALLLVTAVALSLVSQLPKLTVDTSNESFFRPDDRVLMEYNRFRDQFGKDEYIVIALSHPNIFSIPFLEKLQGLHRGLEREVPYLDEVTSLVNIRNTRGEEDEVVVEDFLKKWPKDQTDLDTLRRRAAGNSLYGNYILSENGSMTTIIIKPFACNPDGEQLLQTEGSCQPMSTRQNREMMTAISTVAAKYRSADIRIAISGMPAVIDSLNTILEKDLAVIIPMTFIMVIVFLWLLFRRISGVIYPVAIFIISLLSTVGLMAMLKIPLTNITTILPSFMLVAGVSDAIHILSLFYQDYQITGKKERAIVSAMVHSGLPVLMTTLTTAGGLMSFCAAEIAPIVDLGIVASIGVLLALFYTVLLLPALVAIFPVRHTATHRRQQRLDRFFLWLAGVTCRRQWLIISVFAILLVAAIGGASKLRFAHNALKWFPEDSVIRQDTELIDREMRGTVSLDVVIDTGKSDGLYDPAFIDSLEKAISTYSEYRELDLYVGKILALTTVLKETNRALHENSQDHYRLPESRELIAQELFLFQLSGTDDLEELVDQQFSKTRLALHLPYRDSAKFRNLVNFVERDLQNRFPQCRITITGVNALFIEILNKVMVSMAKSYALALLSISVMMIFMLGKLRMGLLSMLPNLFPIVMVMGLMGWFGIPLDFGTILIGSVSIGIVVDDTIHYFYNFDKYYDRSGDPLAATERALKTVGRAMLATSVVLVGGFLCNMFSELNLNKYSGFLIASTLVIALIADFFLSTALLSLVYGQKVPSPEIAEVES